MNNFYNILPIIINVIVLIIIVRAGAIALMLTGINSEKAHFQALSAFTGTGFTTNESERTVNNKIRRRIISFLIIFGNGGLITLFVTATIGDGYIVKRIILKDNSKFIGKTVLQVNQELNKRLIIGIERYEKWISLPQDDTVLALHDIIVVYGKAK